MAERESIRLWSTTALTNGSVDPSIDAAEGQLPSSVNNGVRSIMAANARKEKDTNGSLTTTGSANAYLLTINNTWTALATGQVISFKASFTSTGASTINVTNADAAALGAKAIRMLGDVVLASGSIISGGHYICQYDAAANSAAGAWLLINPSSGTGTREVLTSTRTYYVRKDGSDSNTGLADTAAGAKLTIQAGVNAAASIDAGLQQVIVQVRAGTYTEDVELKPVTGVIYGGIAVLIGDTTTPSNVAITGTSTSIRGLGWMPDWLIEGFKITSSAVGIQAHAGAWIRLGFIDFGACTTTHVLADQEGTLEFQYNYSISGGAAFHAIANTHGRVLAIPTTVTLTDTPAFSSAFIYANGGGKQDWGDGITFTGAATGSRYAISDGGQLDCDTANPDTYFPGNAAGTLDAGSRIFGNTTRHGKIQIVDGTVALPAFTWASDLDCGLYRIGANNIGAAVNGAKVLDIGTAGLGITGTLSTTGALTYGGVTLSNAVTGTGNMVLSAGPTLTGTTTIATLALTTVGAYTISGAITYGGVTLSNAVTGTGNMVLSASPTLTGTTTIATLALTTVGAHTISGAITYGGVTLSNSVTGTGKMVLDTSPTLVTPTLGAATATSLTFSPTTGGIVGTTTNDNAAAGKVGEYVESIVVTGSAVSLTTLTVANLTSISLTAGDWDVFCNGRFTSAATTVTTQVRIGLSTTSATFPGDDLFQMNIIHFGTTGATNSSNALNTPPTRMSLSGTTTVYGVALGQFTTSTMTVSGRLYARRVR